MRKVIATAVLLATLAACAPKDPQADGHFIVVSNVFPVSDVVVTLSATANATHIDGTNLTPAGVEPHDYELTSDDIDLLRDAEVVVYVGDLQPALERALEQREGKTVDVGKGLRSIDSDPHFWLDPTLMAKAARRVGDALDIPATTYLAKLRQLDEDFGAGLANCERRDIVTAHASFAYLAKRYGLTQHSISGVSPDAEPGPQALARLSELIKREGVTTVFYEELVPRDFADTLAKDAGVKTAVLNPLEALTKKQEADGDDYFSIMRENLAALRTALGCA